MQWPLPTGLVTGSRPQAATDWRLDVQAAQASRESIPLQQRVHELPVPQRGIGHDLSQMGVICRAELVFDDNHSSSDVTGENVSGMDGHSLECEANRGGATDAGGCFIASRSRVCHCQAMRGANSHAGDIFPSCPGGCTRGTDGSNQALSGGELSPGVMQTIGFSPWERRPSR
jgi:hypothetical protein